MRNNLPVTNREIELTPGKTIVSTTDLKGKITYANRYFIEISGFEESELIGAPHNVLRHPDMPAEAFSDLWQTIQSGLPWSALVKNRCKNGDHYWVVANVTPVIENGQVTGYMSVRTMATREQIEKSDKLYKDIKAGNTNKISFSQGQAVEAGWRQKFRVFGQLTLGMRIGLSMGAIAMLGFAAITNAVLAGTSGLSIALSLASALLALFFWFSMQKVIVIPLRQAILASKILAGGDLTTRIEANRHDDVGQLMLLLRQLNINLSSIIGDIRNNFGQILVTTEELSRANLDLSGRTESQASSLEETSASMEQLTSSVEQNATNTSEVNSLATDTQKIAASTGSTVSQVVSAMDDISNSSRQIRDIVGIIDAIAFQTNILALNAAVEAARAGEQGRGFAVVASEVRNLAQRSAAAAKEIKTLIDISTTKVEAGAGLANEAGKNMDGVIRSIQQVATIMADIRLATREQSSGISQVKDAIVQLDDVTQQNAAMVEQAAASAHILEDQSLAISNALKVFKLDMRSSTVQSAARSVSGPLRTLKSIGSKAALIPDMSLPKGSTVKQRMLAGTPH